VRHPKVKAWEARLKAVFDGIDHELEARYGERLARRPGRPAAGATANPEHGGLFNLGGVYTRGYGSTHGPGYVVEMRIAAVGPVSADLREAIEADAVALLRARLPEAFPGQALQVSRDGRVWKIHGDFSLGEV
jgi:hypothetical protein